MTGIRNQAGCNPNLISDYQRPRSVLRIQEAAQFAAAAGVLQLAQRLGLDLAYSLAGDRELLTTSSSVWSVFMPMPKRMRSTRSSRGVRLARTRVVVSRRFAWMAASSGRTTLGS